MSRLESFVGEMFGAVFCTSFTLRFGESPYRIIPGSVKKLRRNRTDINPHTGEPLWELDEWVAIRVNTGGQVQFKIESSDGAKLLFRAFDFVGDYKDREKPPCGRVTDMYHNQRKDFLHPKRKEEVPFLPGVTGVWKP